MKVWIKLLIGSVLGILLGRFLPFENKTVQDTLIWLESLAINVGRYTVVPIIVFSLSIAIYELRQNNRFWSLVFKSFLFMVGIAVFVIGAGMLVTTLFPPTRIPIFIGEQTQVISLNIAENISDLFPSNMFAVFTGSGVYLFPFCIFAFFLSMGLSYDRTFTRSVIALIDSCSRIFFHIASFFSEILGVAMIILASYWMVRFHSAFEVEAFRNLILFLAVLSVVIGLVVMPLLLYLLRPRINPWAILYGSISTALTGFFSGDINFTLPILLVHAKNSLGVKRRANVTIISLFATFARAGSAMVAMVAFMVIVKSYSIRGIPYTDMFFVGVRALVISFLLARHPGDGAYIALAILCTGYGHGFEAGYLIVKPLAFYLIAIGTFLDVMIAYFSTFVIARINGFQEEAASQKA